MRHLRFSLRTLLFLVLLIASFTTLWWNWGPWEVARVVEEDGRILFTSFSGRYLVYTLGNTLDDARSRTSRLVIRDMAFDLCLPELSQRYADLKISNHAAQTQWFNVICQISESGDYAVLCATNHNPLLFKTRTKEFAEIPGETNLYCEFISNESWLGFENGGLYRLPGLEAHVSNKIIDPKTQTSANDRWVVAWKNGQTLTYRNCGNERTRAWNGPSQLDGMVLKGDRLVCDTGNAVIFYDVNSGSILMEISGEIGDWSCESDLENRLVTIDRKLNTVSIWELSSTITKIQTIQVPSPDYPIRIKADRLFVSKPLSIYRVSSGEVLWTDPRDGNGISQDWRFVSAPGTEKSDACIMDAESGRKVFEFSRWRWGKELPEGPVCPLFLKGSTDLMTIGSNVEYSKELLTSSNRIALWKLKRPCEWYGVAWLPEFWLTAAFAAGLVWSLWRDRTNLKGKTKP